MPTVLLGSQEEGNAAGAVGVTKPVGFRFLAKSLGTDEAIEVRIRGSSTATAVRVGIAADGAGGLVPGALLAGTNETEHACTTSEETIVVTGLNVPGLVAGSAYWLLVTPVSGTLKIKRSTSTEGEAHRSVIATKVGTVLSAVTEWTAEQTGPMFIAGTGAEGVHASLSASAGGRGSVTGAKTEAAGSFASSAAARGTAAGFVGGKSSVQASSAARGGLTAAKTMQAVLTGHLGGEGVMSGFKGSVVRNVYYGPAGEAAGEKLRLEKGEGCRYMDIYPGAAPGSPLALLFHGGGWVNEQWHSVDANAEYLAAAGMMLCNVNYRDASETVGAFPSLAAAMQIEDVEEAIVYARAHAAGFNGNQARTFLVGGSAGGHLAAIAACRMNAVADVVKGVACLSIAACDLQDFCERMESGAYREYENQETKTGKLTGDTPNLKAFMQHTQWALQQTLDYTGTVPGWAPVIAPGKPKTTATESREIQRKYSPARLGSPGACKWLLFTAELDLIERRQPEAMVAKLTAEGKASRIELNIVPEPEGHAFSYWSHADPTVGESPKKRIIAFIFAAESSLGGTAAVTGTVAGKPVFQAPLAARAAAHGTITGEHSAVLSFRASTSGKGLVLASRAATANFTASSAGRAAIVSSSVPRRARITFLASRAARITFLEG